MEPREDKDPWGKIGARLAVIALLLGGARYTIGAGQNDAISIWNQQFYIVAGILLTLGSVILVIHLADHVRDTQLPTRWTQGKVPDVSAFRAGILASLVIALALSAGIGDATGNHGVISSCFRAVVLFHLVYCLFALFLFPWRQALVQMASLVAWVAVYWTLLMPVFDNPAKSRKTMQAELLTLCGTLAAYPGLKPELRERCLAEGQDRLESLIKEMKPSDP